MKKVDSNESAFGLKIERQLIVTL